MNKKQIMEMLDDDLDGRVDYGYTAVGTGPSMKADKVIIARKRTDESDAERREKLKKLRKKMRRHRTYVERHDRTINGSPVSVRGHFRRR